MTSNNQMMILLLIWMRLPTPNIIIEHMTENTDKNTTTTATASSFKINDNDPLYHELLNAPKAKTITLFTPPLAEGEHNHEPQITRNQYKPLNTYVRLTLTG